MRTPLTAPTPMRLAPKVHDARRIMARAGIKLVNSRSGSKEIEKKQIEKKSELTRKTIQN
jgi:hypothetical protein